MDCTGKLGHWLFREDFGSGTGHGPALPPGVTNMAYTQFCPPDGFYTLVSTSDGCAEESWHKVIHDHTGNSNGYMMMINASNEPSTFYTRMVPSLCPATAYEFSAYILNLLKNTVVGPTVQQPDILFSIETTAGEVLDTLRTGSVTATAGPVWKKYNLVFKTPDNVNSLVLKISNRAPGGPGNDLMLDDIEFITSAPKITVPTMFSPNGDGINDVWNITNLDAYTDCELTVFDRSGGIVFKSIGYDTPWNGTRKGAPLDTGTYYYTIDLKTGAKRISGWVFLMR
ncbi:gliding motility-associated C-terminal domain-containing protein [Mucilaginibacter sp. SMC90]|uniref:gliding motility-associated C-terminal domain-containing protein n=1 Tax=Mucilaginibacter sp. SMC90 TaxID=2929803 RepID=UPI001FB2E6F8|nr:gliding motility-associated C-terminal domain-containing protein [Mucilaginibacter sp. SMC90]UOE48426.1 gliding motility-associated C-terminal domain-containing protein [Mucilaginibacter sp. SMC90]